jgi:hypothetical protein
VIHNFVNSFTLKKNLGGRREKGEREREKGGRREKGERGEGRVNFPITLRDP